MFTKPKNLEANLHSHNWDNFLYGSELQLATDESEKRRPENAEGKTHAPFIRTVPLNYSQENSTAVRRRV